MSGGESVISARYYRAALIYAKNRDLSSALNCTRISIRLDAENEKAVRLLRLCLYELGIPCADNMLADIEQEFNTTSEAVNARAVFERVKELTRSKKWRAALSELKRFPYKSVRVLNIEGCIYASAGNVNEAGKRFAQALWKDRGNTLAFEGFAQTVHKRGSLLGFLRFVGFDR